jgi:hypothetical protein
MLMGGALVLLLAGLAGQADEVPEKKPPTLKEEFAALQKEYSKAQQGFFEALRKAKPEEQQKVIKEEAGKLDKVAAKLVALAEKHPKEPAAVDALITTAQDSFTSQAGGGSRKKAMELLMRDHITSDKLGQLCQQLANGFEPENEKLLRALLEKSPSKAVQAEACLALSQNLSQRANLARRLAEDKSLAKRVEGFLGTEATAALIKLDTAKLDAESEKATKLFAEKYLGEVKPARLVQVCQRLAFSTDKGSEALLRKLQSHEKKEVKGLALLTLAQVLKRRADEKADKDAKAAEGLLKEAEKLFEEAAKKYGDVEGGYRGKVSEVAKRELYELRNLAIGKPAPEVSGEDQDGKKFKLSDYKGKVVLFDFWSQY